AGSPDKILMRYRYQFRNLLQYGFTAEKDAGEYFRFGNGNFGMDFYSFHLFMRQTVGIEAVALGDFTIQMGQGLIQFQGMAFKKGAEVVQVKRQSPVLKPYTASGEYNFHRGVAVSLKKGSWTSTVFASYRRLSATLNEDAVSGRTISSVNTYGLHRTELEISRKGNLEQWCGGGAAKFHFGAGDIGVNAVAWSFGYPWLKDKFPYQLYAVRGDKWINASVDFSCTYRQVHVFGEFALDPQTDYAVVAGIMMAPDRKMSVGMLYRNISSGFQSLMSNAFTENSTPSNEQGFYTGLSLKPDLKWQIDGYADWFKFPWLKFRVNSPAAGSDYFVNITHKPTRKVEIVLRYRYEAKPLNPSGTKEVVVVPESVISESVRLHIGYQPGKIWELRWRWEQKRLSAGNRYSDGFLWYQDIRFKSPAFRWNLDIRVLYAETDSWDSRLYAYENDVLNAGSISAFSGKGWRLYLNWGYKFSRRFRFWWKVGYSGIGKSDAIETEAPGESKKLDAKIQLQVLW
ncbi:MAG TPA: hypothetical protein VIK74_02730, partial [Parasegetibacter sp.]